MLSVLRLFFLYNFCAGQSSRHVRQVLTDKDSPFPEQKETCNGWYTNTWATPQTGKTQNR